MKFAPITYFITGHFKGPATTTLPVHGYAVRPDTPCPLRLCVRRDPARSGRWLVDHWDTGMLAPIGARSSREDAVRDAVARICEQERRIMRQLRGPGARESRALVKAARREAMERP